MNYIRVRNYNISTPLITILQYVKSNLTNGKLKQLELHGSDDILVTCPFHKDGLENRASCHIYCGDSKEDLTYGTFHCFTCGEKGNFIKFVAACFNSSISFAEQWLIENFAAEEINIEHYQFDDDINLSTNKTNYIDESQLDSMQTWHPYLAQRKLSPEVCKLFKVRYDTKTKCIVFPVWDIDNNLVMLTKRSVETKHFYIQKDCEKPVYLLNYIQANNINTVVVCESQINALTCFSLGIPAIALLGTGTREQYESLNKSCIKHYILAFDGDDAGDKGITRFIKNIRKDVYVDIMLIPRGRDINDLSLEELSQLKVINSNDWVLTNH